MVHLPRQRRITVLTKKNAAAYSNITAWPRGRGLGRLAPRSGPSSSATAHTQMDNLPTATSMKIPRIVFGFVPYLSILLPFGAAVFYVHLFGVNVFFADEWSFVPLVQKLDSDTLTLWDLFAHENEHIRFFPWVVMLLLGTLTRYDTIPLMYLVQICLLATSIVLFFAFRRDLKHQPVLSTFLFVPIPFLVFSLRHFENMLWGYQISFAFSQTFAVLALYLIYAAQNKDSGKLISLLSPFVLALVGATVASFSAIQGLLVWPAGILQLLIAPTKRPVKNLLLGVWGLIGLGEWVFYFVGDVKSESSTSTLSYALGHPAEGLVYFLTLLGGSLFWQDALAFSGGLLLVCLLLAGLLLVCKNGRLKDYSFWVALLLFSLLSLMAVTVGRVGLANEQVWARALDSRYAIFSILAVVSIYAIFVKLVWERRSQVAIGFLGGVIGLVMLSIPTSYFLGVQGGQATKTYREETAEILLNYKSQPDEALAKLGYGPKRTKPYIPFLERRKYNVFAEGNTT